MEQKRRLAKWPFIVTGVVVIGAAAAIFIVFQLFLSSQRSEVQSVVVSTTAELGTVSTSASGTGSLAALTYDETVPIGITVGEVFVAADDTVAVGDALAAVDADSVTTALANVETEIAALESAVANVSGSAQIKRTLDAYTAVHNELNRLAGDGYLRATHAGTINSVNISKGATITVSTGSSAGNGSSGSGGSGSSGNSGNSGSNLPVSYTESQEDTLLQASAASSLFASTGLTGAVQDWDLKVSQVEPLAQTSYNTAVSSDDNTILEALVTASTTVSEAKEACTSQQTTQEWLTWLCGASGEDNTAATPVDVALTVKSTPTFRPSKGVYVVSFSARITVSGSEETLSVTTVVVVEDDTESSVPGSGAGAGAGSGGMGTGGTGSSDMDDLDYYSTGSGGTGTGGTGGSGSGDTESTKDPEVSGIKAVAFVIDSTTEMSVSLSLDETDVASVRAGQKATVSIDALTGQQFDGKVTKISLSEGNYSALIAIERTEDMYVGFAAAATIIKESAEDVVVIPLAAVQQRAGELFVYTSVTGDGTMGGEQLITTGLSSADYVEVSSGLSAGQTVCYLQTVGSGAATSSSSNGMNFMGGSVQSFNIDGGGGPPQGMRGDGSGPAMRSQSF